MTWTPCPHCNRATFAYGDHCKYCGKPLPSGRGGYRALLGMGGRPLPEEVCLHCHYINHFEWVHEQRAAKCKACGMPLRKVRETPGRRMVDYLRKLVWRK